MGGGNQREQTVYGRGQQPFTPKVSRFHGKENTGNRKYFLTSKIKIIPNVFSIFTLCINNYSVFLIKCMMCYREKEISFMYNKHILNSQKTKNGKNKNKNTTS